jgi:hypothetical protein
MRYPLFVLKFFQLKDKKGEKAAVTKPSLPVVRQKVFIKAGPQRYITGSPFARS